MSESRLAIVIDSRQAKPTAEDLARALDAVDAAGVRVTSSSQRAGRSAANAGRFYAQAGKDASTGAAGVDRVNRSMQQTESSATAAGAAIRRHLIAAVGGLSAMKLIDIADQWGQLDARMKMATRSAEEHRIAQERMAASAKSTYRDINETREAFIQLSPVLRDMGMSLEQSMDAVDAFSGLLVTNAATGERAGAAMRAFALALQKGKMDADGWITIYSTMDTIVDEIAAHTGIAAEEIRKLGAEGKLSVDMLANALAGRLEPIMQQVAEMPVTVRDAFQNLSTEFGEWVGKANDAINTTRSLAASIEVVGNNIDAVMNVALVAAGGALAGYAGKAGLAAKASYDSVMASIESAKAAHAEAVALNRSAEAARMSAAADLERARAAVVAAEGQVAADRIAQASNIERMKAMQQLMAAENALEVQRIKAQISDIGRQKAATRMAEIRLAEVAMAKQVEAAERSLAATTTATSTQVQAAYAARSKAAGAYAEAAKAANATAAGVERAAASANIMARAGSSLLGVLGGPVGLAVTAGLTATAFMTMGSSANAASSGIDTLSDSLSDLNKRQLELRRFALEDQMKDLEAQAIESAQILRTLQADHDALTERYGHHAEGMENVRRALLEQEEAYDKVSGELDRKRHQLDQTVVALQDLNHAAQGATSGVNTLNAAMGHTEAGEKYLAQIQGRIKALQDGGDPVKAATRWIHEHADASEADKTAIMSAALAEQALQKARDSSARSTKSATSAVNEAKKAAESFERERRQYLNGLYGEVSALGEQARGLEQQIELYGLAESATYDYAIAQLEQEKAAIAVMDAGAEEIAILERKIELLQQMKGSQQTLERLDAEKQAWESWSRDVEQIFDQVGQSLTDAIFEGGKSGRDLIKDLFKTLTLRVLVQPVMGALQGAVANSLGGVFGHSNPAGGAGGLSSLSSLLTGNNIGSGISQTAYNLFNQPVLAAAGGVGPAAPTAISGLFKNAGNYGNLAYGAAGILGGLGAGAIFGNQGQSSTLGGIGSTIGLAAGGPLGAVAGTLIGGGIGSLFGSREPTTRRGQRTTIDYLDGVFGTSSVDGRQAPGADAAARQMAEQAVQTANGIFKQVGVDAAIDSFYAIMESSYKGDRDGVASGGSLRIGDQTSAFGIGQASDMTLGGFGGWSDAEMLPRLATDIQLSLIEALQKAGVMSHRLDGIDVRGLDASGAEQLATTIQLAVQEISALQVAVERLPFANLRDLSFEAYDGLLMLTGGLDNLIAAEQSYLQNFHTEAERTQLVWDEIGRVMGGVNLSVPDSRDGFRQMKESLDLSTESGRQAYAAIMSVQDAFASVTQSADELAEAAIRLAQEQSRAAEEQLRAAEQAARDEHDRLARVADYQLQAAVSQLNAAWSAVQHHAQQEISRLQQTFSATDSLWSTYQSRFRSLESELGGLLTTIGRGVSDLRGQVEATSQMQYAQARAVISTAVVTGQLPQTADLTEAMRIAQQGVAAGRYGSAFEQREAYLKLAAEMEALQGIAQPELDTARASLDQLEKQYNKLRGIEGLAGQSLSQLERQLGVAMTTETTARTQIAAIESQLAWAERQYNALMGIGSGITDLASAMRAFNSASGAVKDAQSNPASRDQRYYEAKLDQLRRENPSYGGVDWTTATVSDLAAVFRKEGMTPEQHYRLHGRYEGLSYDTGTSYVPRDMMANIHQGEIIIDPRSSDILRRYGIGVQGAGGQEVVRELRQMSGEIKGLRTDLKASQFAIAKNTMKIARMQEKWDAIGMPHEQEEVPA